jgi:hypothetical protein
MCKVIFTNLVLVNAVKVAELFCMQCTPKTLVQYRKTIFVLEYKKQEENQRH